jgi:predicted AAA+ superfamily ATPase
MIKREMTPELLAMAQQYPVVTLLGPRQSGKTTLVRKTFHDKIYVNLEELDIRSYAQNDPRGFLEHYPGGAIFDEIQNAPGLLSYLQVLIDERQKNGDFILTGSHQLEVHQAVTQSLAGRVAILTLLPLTISELASAEIQQTEDEYLFRGFYPRIYQQNLQPTKAYNNYLHTYVERDVHQLINVKDLSTFNKFITLCAGRIGQELNMNSLSNEVGVSSHTIKQWLSILEASFLIVLLQPYFENLGKRVVKSPKLYFVDVGFASHILGITEVDQLKRDPLRGNLFENLVVMELIKSRHNQGWEPNLYFYRDNQRNEVDVIYKRANELAPIEIKSAKTFNEEFTKGIDYFAKLIGERCGTKSVIYAGDKEMKINDVQLLNYKHAVDVLK